MSDTIVVYKGYTGFTERYAELIAQALGCDKMRLADATPEALSRFSTVIFGGRVHAGFIDGLKRVRKLLAQSGDRRLVVFATGGTPSDATELIDKLWLDNLTEAERQSLPHFYMQSGICYERMPLMDKLMMKAVGKLMAKKRDKDENEQGFQQAIGSSYDISSPEYIEPLVKYIQETAKE